MQKRILLLFIVSLFLFSCSQNPTEPERREVIILFDVREDEFVMLTIYDQFDMLVKVLINDEVSAGNGVVTWDCTNEEGHQVASGYYYYIIRVNGFITERTMILLK